MSQELTPADRFAPRSAAPTASWGYAPARTVLSGLPEGRTTPMRAAAPLV
jgi:hypothetical protein